MDAIVEKLFTLALMAQKNAYAPVSHFHVGAALITANGTTFSGCNVEDATLTLTTHAEVNAIDSMVTSGQREIKSILILTQNSEPTLPCALCRQKIAEFAAKDISIIAATPQKKFKTFTLAELYPFPFTLKDIQQGL